MTAVDPLAAFRRGPAPRLEPEVDATASEAEAGDEARGYVAFRRLEQRAARIWIRGMKIDHVPSYRAIYDMVTDGRTGITLAMEGMTVDIDGRNLGELFYGLTQETIAEIRVYDAAKWPEPGEGEAVVERVAVHLTAGRYETGTEKIG